MADYKNAEQYPDPTAYAALKKIEREEQTGFFRPLVYICSPYAGDVVTNTKNGFLYEYNPTYRNGPNEEGPSGKWETDVL